MKIKSLICVLSVTLFVSGCSNQNTGMAFGATSGTLIGASTSVVGAGVGLGGAYVGAASAVHAGVLPGGHHGGGGHVVGQLMGVGIIKDLVGIEAVAVGVAIANVAHGGVAPGPATIEGPVGTPGPEGVEGVGGHRSDGGAPDMVGAGMTTRTCIRANLQFERTARER